MDLGWFTWLSTTPGHSDAARTNTKMELLEIPDRSESDKKDYKYMVLANNLKVLLVSDNIGCNGNESHTSTLPINVQTDKKLSAVALMVDVGSWAEPRKFQGLAHFLEHMIFMGSKKYPEENSFSKHITKYGGYDNACTNNEETIYYFEVSEDHLDSSIDYFVAQLKEPLFMQESMTREREAVDSEYQLLVNNDDERRYQLLKFLASEKHPLNNFLSGNMKSLKEDIESDQELHTNLVAFYKRHYSSHRMFACIQSCLPLQQLEDLAIKHFADISSNQLPGLDFSQYNYKEAFRKEFYEEVFFVKSIENVCKLDLCWVLPSTIKLYKCKPSEFVSWLLGYEGKGSLCAYLRKRLWSLELTAGAEPNPMFTLFTLNIILTDLGLKNLDKVLEATFCYIKLFNKASELKEIYEEISFIRETNFRYATEISASDNVPYLVKCCKDYLPKDILRGAQLFFHFDEDEVQNVLDHLNMFHFNIMLTTQQGYADEVYDKKEKWFGTEYTSRKLPENWLELWQNCQIMPELYLPQANPFIARDFRIFWLENGKQEQQESPQKLIQTEMYELWFRQDDKFLLPHGFMFFYFKSPLLRKNGRNSILCGLYLGLVEHYLEEELYPAKEAGISYEIYCADNGIVLQVNGYNEKLHLVVEILIRGFISTIDCINENQLETFKKQLKKSYFNALIKPEVVNNNLQAHILTHKHWLLSDNNKHINDISLGEIQLFAEEFIQELYVQALIQGNLREENASEMMSTVMKYLNCSAIKEKSLMADRGTEIPLGSHEIFCRNLNPKDCNSVITHFYQIGPCSLRNECILNLIVMILQIPIYDTLRTKQQLGYTVYLTSQSYHGIMGYFIYVASPETKHSSDYVAQCIDAFRQDILKILKELSLEDFENFKSSIIKLKKIKHLTLYEEVNCNWSEITDEKYMFQRRSKEIEILQALQKQDILTFWQKNEGRNLRKLSVNVVGSKTNEKHLTTDDNEAFDDNDLELEFIDLKQDGAAIMNVAEFKENLHVYPAIKSGVISGPIEHKNLNFINL